MVHCRWVLAVVLLLVAVGALAHSEPPQEPPPPPPPPPPTIIQSLVRARPLRWSWLHWWEANRDPYLNALAQERGLQESLNQVDPQLRSKANEALIKGLADDHSYVRYTCALALGRMRQASAFDALKQSYETDTNEMVRFAALVALGLIGDEPSRSLLLNSIYPTDFLRDAAIRGLGLAQPPTEVALQGLRKLVREYRSPYANAAVWTLSRHPTEEASFYREVIAKSTNPWLVNDAILALGSSRDKLTDRLLTALVMQADQVSQVPAWAFLENIHTNKYKIADKYRNSDYDQTALQVKYDEQHRRLFDLMPRALRSDQAPPEYKNQLVVVGIEQIYQQRLRAAAAIALEHAPQEVAVPALHTLIQEPEDSLRYNVLPKCFAAISLGRIASAKSLPLLMQIVDDRLERRAKTQDEIKTPLRGFAALALGMYAHSQQTKQGPYNRPGYDKACELLVTRLADRKEQMEMRTACAVALGLAGRGEYLRPMILVSEHLDTRDDYLLIGYILLARAMLGDQNVLDPAVKMLALPPHRDPTTNILARRAAVLSMGVHGGDDAVPRLANAWEESYYVNREVILALSLCHARGVSNKVVPLLLESQSPGERAYIAQVLGELFVEDRPEPLTRFLINSNFPMRDPAKQPYRAFANEFLYNQLIREFGDTWY